LPFQSKLLITCNNKVQLHKMVAREDGSKELRPDCSHGGNIIALYLAARWGGRRRKRRRRRRRRRRRKRRKRRKRRRRFTSSLRATCFPLSPTHICLFPPPPPPTHTSSPSCSLSSYSRRGDFIVVGDLMRSVSLLVYKPEEETLELRASVREQGEERWCVSFVTPLETNIIDLWVSPLNLGGLKTMHVAAFE
jgi:hypothetical protein